MLQQDGRCLHMAELCVLTEHKCCSKKYASSYGLFVFIQSTDTAGKKDVLIIMNCVFIQNTAAENSMFAFTKLNVCSENHCHGGKKVVVLILCRTRILKKGPSFHKLTCVFTLNTDTAVKNPGHSAKNADGRLHLNTHIPLTQRSRSGLTMSLSRHSVGTYKETGSHATRQGTFGYSRLRSMSHCGLILV